MHACICIPSSICPVKHTDQSTISKWKDFEFQNKNFESRSLQNNLRVFLDGQLLYGGRPGACSTSDVYAADTAQTPEQLQKLLEAHQLSGWRKLVDIVRDVLMTEGEGWTILQMFAGFIQICQCTACPACTWYERAYSCGYVQSLLAFRKLGFGS